MTTFPRDARQTRRFLLEVMAKQKALADRVGYRFSIGFFDLDSFKEINDEPGHAAGGEATCKAKKKGRSTVVDAREGIQESIGRSRPCSLAQAIASS